MKFLKEIAIVFIAICILLGLVGFGVTAIANSDFIEEDSWMQSKYEDFERWKDEFSLEWPWKAPEDSTVTTDQTGDIVEAETTE